MTDNQMHYILAAAWAMLSVACSVVVLVTERWLVLPIAVCAIFGAITESAKIRSRAGSDT